jgi:hypothetical protein
LALVLLHLLFSHCNHAPLLLGVLLPLLTTSR